MPILTDIHEPAQAQPAAEVADILQIPAFLCRQTDLIVAAARTGRAVNVKKGQFLAPDDMRHVIDKVRSTGNHRVMVTERGISFGYHNLVVDMRAFPMLRAARVSRRVRRDAQPAAARRRQRRDGGSGGVHRAAGVGGSRRRRGGVFLEVHERPEQAKSDAQNALPLARLEPLLCAAGRHRSHRRSSRRPPASLSRRVRWARRRGSART